MLCARARRPKNAGPYEDAGDQRPAPEQRGEVMTGCGAKPAKLLSSFQKLWGWRNVQPAGSGCSQ